MTRKSINVGWDFETSLLTPSRKYLIIYEASKEN